MIDKIQWVLRWATLLWAAGSTIYLVMTWEWTNWYIMFALTVVSIYFHAACMLLGWWKPSK